MRLIHHAWSVLLWILACAWLVSVWWYVWPTSLAGHTTFTVVQGQSMEPEMHFGDLVYARSSAQYRPGDIVVYRIPDGQPGEGQLVIHRVIERHEDGTLVIKGDNRESTDDVVVTDTDVLGKSIKNLGPVAGKALGLLPIAFALVVGAVVTFLLWPQEEYATLDRGDETDRLDDDGEDSVDIEDFDEDLELARFSKRLPMLEVQGQSSDQMNSVSD